MASTLTQQHTSWSRDGEEVIRFNVHLPNVVEYNCTKDPRSPNIQRLGVHMNIIRYVILKWNDLQNDFKPIISEGLTALTFLYLYVGAQWTVLADSRILHFPFYGYLASFYVLCLIPTWCVAFCGVWYKVLNVCQGFF